MDSIISQYVSNWNNLNLLISSGLPFISNGKVCIFRDNIISNQGIILKGWKEGIHIFMNKSVAYSNGFKHGKEIQWDENGQKEREIDYLNGEKNGKEIWWYESKKKREINYSNDKKNGKYTEWYKNGKKRYETNYSDDEKYGKEIWWYENGEKEYEIDHSEQ